jgi:hypothetical protein
MTTLAVRLAFCFTVFLLVVTGPLHSQVCSPSVLLKGQPDARNLKTLVQGLYSAAGAETDRQKAETIWRYLLTDGRFVEPGMVYHIAGWAYEEPAGEVLDPLKLLNSYGLGLCYQFAPLLEAMFEAGGFEDARCWFLTGHTVTEVFYNGKYHLFDSDMLGYTTIGDGDPRKMPVAGVRELEGDKNIILSKLLAPDRVDSTKVVYPWYPADVRAKAMDGYAGGFTSREDNWLYPYTRYPSGHTMDFVLRPGERMTRFFQPEARGIYYLPYKKVDGDWQEFPREISRWKILTEEGPKSQKDLRLWGTGLFEYRPALWEKSAYYPVFSPGFNENLRLPSSEQEGFLERESKTMPASAVFDMPSPYVLIDAAFSLDVYLASPVCRLLVETSVDGGRSWQACGSLAGPYSGPWEISAGVIHSSEHGALTAVSGHYGYLVRFSFNGPLPDEAARIGDICLKSRFQHNPRTLPELGPGENELVYMPGPQRRRWNVPVDIKRLESSAAKVASLQCVEEDDNLILRPVDWRKGELIIEAAAPGEEDLSGFQAGGRFLVLEGLAPEKLTAETRETAQNCPNPRKARASLAWAPSAGGPFTTLWEYDPAIDWPDRTPESRLLRWPEVDKLVDKLPANTRKVYLRYRLEGMALDDIRLAVYTPPSRATDRKNTIKVTHEWAVNGVGSSFSREIGNPASEFGYTVYTGPRNIKNLSLIMACPQ